MGVPVIDAPTEAEAQCAVMAKAGLVYGVATEDMDCLTFGAPRWAKRVGVGKGRWVRGEGGGGAQRGGGAIVPSCVA